MPVNKRPHLDAGELKDRFTWAASLQGLTMMLLLAMAVLGIAFGRSVHCFALVVFGADSAIQVVPASMMLRRWMVELNGGEAEFHVLERRMRQLVRLLIVILGYYVVGEVVWAWNVHPVDRLDVAGNGAAAATLIGFVFAGMLVLATLKSRLAQDLRSTPMRIDADDSFIYVVIAAVIALALGMHGVVHSWLLDSGTAVAVVCVLAYRSFVLHRSELFL